MYKQFALTIAISVLLSAFNALTLTPALCAMLLKPPKPMRGPLGVFFRGFNKVFDVDDQRLCERLAHAGSAGNHHDRDRRRSHSGRGLLWQDGFPAGFIPDEDQGILGVNVQLPPGASLARTSEVLKKVEEILSKNQGIESYQTIGGYGVVTNTYPA